MEFDKFEKPRRANRFLLAMSVSSVAALVFAVPLAVAAINAPSSSSNESVRVWADDGASYVALKSDLVKEPAKSETATSPEENKVKKQPASSTAVTINTSEREVILDPAPPTLSPITTPPTVVATAPEVVKEPEILDPNVDPIADPVDPEIDPEVDPEEEVDPEDPETDPEVDPEEEVDPEDPEIDPVDPKNP